MCNLLVPTEHLNMRDTSVQYIHKAICIPREFPTIKTGASLQFLKTKTFHSSVDSLFKLTGR